MVPGGPIIHSDILANYVHLANCSNAGYALWYSCDISLSSFSTQLDTTEDQPKRGVESRPMKHQPRAQKCEPPLPRW
jgi:hypothetical protein